MKRTRSKYVGRDKHCDEQSKALLLDIVSDMNKVVDYRVSEATIEQIAKKYAEIFPAVSPAQDDAVMQKQQRRQ